MGKLTRLGLVLALFWAAFWVLIDVGQHGYGVNDPAFKAVLYFGPLAGVLILRAAAFYVLTERG